MLSPKAVAATLIPLFAAALLFLITGDNTYLVACLLALVGGGAAVAAPPAPGVRQEEVDALSEQRRDRLGP